MGGRLAPLTRGAGRLAAGAALAAAGCSARAPSPPVVLAPPATLPSAPPAADTARRLAGNEGDRRFLIVAVGDSTVSFLAPRDRWVRSGMYGIAVDPTRRDALVGRLYVQGRVADTAVALVTGQTTRMSPDYVAIFRRPSTPTLRQGTFWGGLATGLAVGGGLVAYLLRGR